MKLRLLSVVSVFLFGVYASDAQAPVASFTSDTSTCVYSCVTFTNNSTNATSWQWTFPGGVPGTSSLQNPGSVCYSLPGNYNVTLIAINSNGSDTLTVANQVKVHALPTLQLTGGQLCDPNKLDWAHWTSVSASTATGVISSNLSISVTQSAGGLSTTSGMYNPTEFPTQYNVPVSATAIKNVNAGIFTFCFSKPVVDPQIALSSIGNPSLNVQITTSTPYTVIWAGPGMTYANDTTFAGQEGYTIVEFPGVQSCISFDYHTSENYCNLAFGVLDTNCQTSAFPPICPGSSVTVTATGNELLQNSFHWTPSAGLNTDTGAVVTATPSVTTTYYATCTANNCTVTDTVTIVVKNVPPPVASISGMSAICFGQSDTLVANSGAKYLWSTGSTTSSIIANTGTTGTYSVTVTDTNSCSASAAKTVNVASSLVFKISGDTAFCQGNTTTLDAGSGYKSYLWSTGETSRTIQVDTVNQYTVTITNGTGCTGTSTTHTRFFTAPSTSITGIASFCQGGSSVLDAGGGFASYQWSTGNLNESITVDSSANYGVTVTDHNGCQATASLQVTVKALPVVNISGLTSLCAGDTSTLDAGSGFANYIWSTGNTGESIRTDTSGNYSVTVTGNNGCIASASASVILHLPVTTISGNTTFCAGDSTVLDAGTGFASYIWSTGETTETIHVNNSDEYSVIVTDNYGCSSPATAETAAFPLPTTTISGAAAFCQGDSSVLDAGAGFAGYLWSTGNLNESITVDTSGLFSVIITDDNGCNSTIPVTVTVNPLPVVSISGIRALCAGDTSTLDAGAGYATYIWSTTDAGENIKTDTAGSYSVTVTDNNGCAGTASATVNVNARPVTSVTGTTSFCPGNSTTLDAGSSFASYIWSTGATSHAIQVNTASGYSVTVTDNNGCTGTAATATSIFPAPSTTVTGITSFCQGDSSVLDAGAGFAGYVWSTGNLNESITVNSASSYSVTVTDNNGCHATASATITVNPLPVTAISGNTSFCPGDSTSLDAGSSFASYTWSTGATSSVIHVNTGAGYSVTVTDGNGCTTSAVTSTSIFPAASTSVTGITSFCQGDSSVLDAGAGFVGYLWSTGNSNETITVNSGSSYSVTVTDNNGCQATASATITVNPLPVTAISGNTSFCPGDSTILNAGGSFASYIWSTGKTSSAIYVNTGAGYSVTVTDGNGCTGSAITSTNIFPAPSTIVTGITSFCQGDSSVLDAGTGFASYLWSTGNSNEHITVQNEASYSVTVTDNNGCHATASTTVTVNPLPVTAISGNTSFCSGDSTTLDAGADFSGYNWSTGASSENITVETGGNYSVTITDVNGCAGTASTTVTVNPLPANPSVWLSGSQTLYCTTDPGYVSYQWFDDSTLIPNATDTSLVITHNGTYQVQVTNGYDCSIMGSTNVIFTGLENIAGNTFSLYPNPAHDQFTISTNGELKNAELEIYNALGELVYEEAFVSKTKTFNLKLTAGIYFVQLRDENGIIRKKIVIG